MPTEAKRAEINALAECIKSSKGLFIVEYRGLRVSQSTNLRKAIKAAAGEMKVAKNTLMRIALKEAGVVTADNIDTGPNAYVFAYDDAAATARVLRDFARERGNEALVIKGGIFGGRVISKDQVLALADLPSREVMLATLLGVLNAPIRSFVTVLSGPARGLVTALTQIKEQKEKAA